MRHTSEAGDGIRTHDNHVGNVVLYQLSYTRKQHFSDRPTLKRRKPQFWVHRKTQQESRDYKGRMPCRKVNP